jgi:hypothetical protein
MAFVAAETLAYVADVGGRVLQVIFDLIMLLILLGWFVIFVRRT